MVRQRQRKEKDPAVPSPGRKRPAGIAQHRWTADETTMILDYLQETVQSNSSIEKPTAAIYYDKMNSKLKLDGITPNKLKAKVSSLKTTYINAVTWRGQTGQGVLEDGGAEAVKAYLLKICPFFDQLDEIFGNKVNVNPPYVFDSGNPPVDDEDNFLMELVEADRESELSPGSASVTTAEPDHSDVDAMKLKLQKPNSKVNPIQPNKKDVATALTDFQVKRTEVMSKKVEVEEKRLENESNWNEREFSHRENELKLMEKRIDTERDLKVMDMEKEERIARFKIEQEMKLQLELAKMKQNSS